jgi:hypothetical protein
MPDIRGAQHQLQEQMVGIQEDCSDVFACGSFACGKISCQYFSNFIECCLFTLSCWLNHAIPRSCRSSAVVKPGVARVQWKHWLDHLQAPAQLMIHLVSQGSQGWPATVIQFRIMPGAHLLSHHLQAASCPTWQLRHVQLQGSRQFRGTPC